MRQGIKSIFAKEMESRGLTPVIASHNLRELEDICDHVGLLHKGGVLLSKDLEDMKCNIQKSFKKYRIHSGKMRNDLFPSSPYRQCIQRASLLLPAGFRQGRLDAFGQPDGGSLRDSGIFLSASQKKSGFLPQYSGEKIQEISGYLYKRSVDFPGALCAESFARPDMQCLQTRQPSLSPKV